ncbi:hypothetical protein BJ165DRAFT_1535304 [Panaeolus papilionaceus]|nr:hypothetical protein BJ165DRAFT_1535304 [Panaeolus papilionaceus]
MSQIQYPNPDRRRIRWFDDTSSSIVYSGTWRHVSRTAAWFAALHSTNEMGASASFSFPGPAYVFINISLPLCEIPGGAFTIRAYIHALDADTSPAVAVACADRRGAGAIDYLEFYSNVVDIPGSQTATIELVNSGNTVPSRGGPLLLDSFGYLPLDGIPFTGFPSSQSSESIMMSTTSASRRMTTQIKSSTSPPTSITTAVVPNASDDVNQVGNSNIALTPANDTQTSFPISALIGLCLAIALGLITLFVLLQLWRRRIRSFCQQRKLRSSSAPEVDMVEFLNPSVTTNTPRYSSLGYSSIHTGTHRPLDPGISRNRGASPNSLFNDTQSTTSTAHINCTALGEDAKHGECYCPTCDETSSNRIRQSTTSSVPPKEIMGCPTSSSAQSHAQSSITAVETNASYRASSAGSHTAASVNSNPLTNDHASIARTSLGGSAPSQNPFGDD